MCDHRDQSTDEFLAIRFPNLDKTWLDEINEMVGWLKQKFKGNGELYVPWSGGIPQISTWSIKSSRKKKPRM